LECDLGLVRIGEAASNTRGDTSFPARLCTTSSLRNPPTCCTLSGQMDSPCLRGNLGCRLCQQSIRMLHPSGFPLTRMVGEYYVRGIMHGEALKPNFRSVRRYPRSMSRLSKLRVASDCIDGIIIGSRQIMVHE